MAPINKKVINNTKFCDENLNPEKEGLLIFVQIDHLSGEEIGWAFGNFQTKTINNFQVIPSLTKKGRPGYLIILDVKPKRENEVSHFLLNHLLVQGSHRLSTRHIFKLTKSKKIQVLVKKGNRSMKSCINIKQDQKMPFFIKSDDLIRLSKKLKEDLDIEASPLELKQLLVSSLGGRLKNSIKIPFNKFCKEGKTHGKND